jgi:hypothetical protein
MLLTEMSSVAARKKRRGSISSHHEKNSGSISSHLEDDDAPCPVDMQLSLHNCTEIDPMAACDV